ncbi:hypothetical protein MEQU1_003150 [Malassezia equina]|uniref:Golgi apparatus membrane protein TVP38 n=1 Tax=Malassezia equina TaxID=1381935 RepID=A0AAF0EF60_9BASI|nr:hypothetical protein MEQU1_003150 [Malassezia equina]
MHAPKRSESHMQRTARMPSLRIHTSQLRSMSHDSEATPRSSSVHPPMRPRSLSRTAAFAAQSLVDALARSFSPTAPHETATLLFDAPASMSPQPLLDEDVRRVFSPPPHRSSPMARVHELSIPMEQLVAPQARHGAVYLRDARPRRRRRTKAPRVPPSQAFLACMRRFVGLLALLVRPRELMTQVRTAGQSHVHAWDEAFRDAATHQRCWWPEWLAAYAPLLIWVGVSVLSTALVMTFHTQVFHVLHALSLYLRGLGLLGRVLFGCMVFLTTFPPLPLYSTLIVLSGFAFGVWQGFLISYIAALSGAAVVFVLSRTWLRPWMVRLLMHAGPLKRVVRAIERQPRLLFLVRLAPYPYNLLNTLLASSHVLTLPTYLLCTAVALPKLLVHTSLGASIENFATYQASGTQKQATRADQLRQLAGGAGLVLCVALLLYLYSVARDAVDSLDDDSDDTLDDEEETEPLRHTACSPTGPLPQHRGTPSDTRVGSWIWREAPPPPLLGAVANLERAAENHMN